MDDVFHCPWCGEVPAAYDEPGWHSPEYCGQTFTAKRAELRAAFGEFGQRLLAPMRALVRLAAALAATEEPD